MFKQKTIYLLIIFLFIQGYSWSQGKGYADYVNPFIGTADNGHTFPGATYPYGMIQVSPETGNNGWEYCSGYRYTDTKIWGFSQTHLNGTGIPDLGDVLLQPFTGSVDRRYYGSNFSKKTETASPGYYSVELIDFGVDVEVTATAHTAFHQYTFNEEKGTPRLLVDLQSGLVSSEELLRNHVLNHEVNFESNYRIQGHSQVKHWVERDYYYVIEFSKPFTEKIVLPRKEGEKASRYVLDFDLDDNEKLKAKISFSTVSIENAVANLESESPDWDFNVIRKAARDEWNRYLSRVELDGSEDQKVNFYTSFYHLLIQPNNIADVNGQYRGADNKVYQSTDKTYYSTLSLWDTYRAAHPLYTILTPEKVDGFVNSMLDHYDQNGYLPIWTLWGKEAHTMIGNHAVPVIADAYLKGFTGFNPDRAFEAISSSLTKNHPKSDWDIFDEYGYLPFDLVKEESVSRTLEHAYDNHAAFKMAKAMGKTQESIFFYNRSQFYRNLLDPETKLMRGKDSGGNWRKPFDLFQISHAGTAGGDYTEGNAWQYTWSVQHDVEGLSKMLGGKEAFVQKLDSLFKLPSEIKGDGFTGDVSGFIGQYAHGNEPSHHVAYLFTLLGEAEKTQELVRSITDKFYLNKPDGLSGNDDCGQMSAWYIFTAMGFYPVDPVGGDYVIGAPQFRKITLLLPNNKVFTIKAPDLSEVNKYVRNITLNGEPYARNFITHADILAGGNLVFDMGPKAN